VRSEGMYVNENPTKPNPFEIILLQIAQWLRCCATNRKVTGSILAGVIGIFH